MYIIYMLQLFCYKLKLQSRSKILTSCFHKKVIFEPLKRDIVLFLHIFSALLLCVPILWSIGQIRSLVRLKIQRRRRPKNLRCWTPAKLGNYDSKSLFTPRLLD